MNLFHESKKVLDKDGKVNPLGPYGKQKLTGREVSTYFRRNKVKDAKIKKAVEVALDLGGAMNVASSEIKKFYGDNILKSKEVQNALKYANEEYVKEGKLPPALQKAIDKKKGKDTDDDEKEVKEEGNPQADAITKQISSLQFKIDRNRKFVQRINDIPAHMRGQGEVNRMGRLKNSINDLQTKIAGLRDKKKKMNPNNEEIENVKQQIKFNEFDTIRNMWEDSLEKKNLEESNLAINEKKLPPRPHYGINTNHLAVNPKNVNKFKPKLQKLAKKFGVELEFGVGGKLPSVVQVKSKSSGAEKNFFSAIQQDKKLMDLMDHVIISKESLNEVTDKEINAVKKLSKDIEKVKKDYFKIAKIGDKTLKDTKHNKKYESILKAQQEILSLIGDLSNQKMMQKEESNLQEVSLDNNMMQRHFANVWSSKDAKLYRVLSQLISQDGFVDNMKAYKKNPKDYLNRLKDIKKNPKKYAKSFGPNFPQYINNPKPGQNYAKLPESTDLFDTYRQMNLEQQDNFNEASAASMIDKLFNLKGNKEAGYGVAKLLNMTGVKVAQAMQKQNPKGFMKTMIDMGAKGSKQLKLPTNKALMKMFKDQGVKPLPESINEESISYRLKIKAKSAPELKAFQKSAKMMKLKVNMNTMFNDTVAVVSGTKKNLRDFDAVVRGRQTYGDPSTIKHFDEK